MPHDVAGLEAILKALADTTRLRILSLLLTGEVCVCHIHESLKVSQPKVSRHLAYLRRAGIVETRRHGVWVYYRLADMPDPVGRAIRDVVMHAIGHLDSPRRDAARLQKKTGCCLPAAAPLTVLPCCGNGDDVLPLGAAGATPDPPAPAVKP